MYNINEVLDEICDAKYTYIGYDKKTCEGVILPSYKTDYANKREAIRSVLDMCLNDYYDTVFQMETKIAELKAKVYTYECIIANSNFAPVIQKGEEHVKNNR